MGSTRPKLQTRRPHLDGRHEGEVANEDDAQLCGHVLHDGPALAAQACRGQTRPAPWEGTVFLTVATNSRVISSRKQPRHGQVSRVPAARRADPQPYLQ